MNKKLKFVLPAVALGIIALAACGASLSGGDGDEADPSATGEARVSDDATQSPSQGSESTQAFTNSGGVEIDVDYERALRDARLRTNGWNTDFSLHTIPFDDITQVIPRDGIPALDDPKFITSEEAEVWLGEKEPVILSFDRSSHI